MCGPTRDRSRTHSARKARRRAAHQADQRIPLARMGLDVPRKPDQPTDYPNAMLMAPGQRLDVLVQVGEPGSYAFRGVPYDQGYPSPTGPIARSWWQAIRCP